MSGRSLGALAMFGVAVFGSTEASAQEAPVAAPPGPAVAATPSDPAKLHNHFGARFEAGYAFRRLYSGTINAVEPMLSLGVQTHGGSVYGVIGGFDGKTNFGLSVYQLHFGGGYDFWIDRFRLGVEGELSTINIGRKTNPNDSIGSLGIALRVRASFDIVTWSEDQLGGQALVLGIAPTANTDATVGFTAFLGVRL